MVSLQQEIDGCPCGQIVGKKYSIEEGRNETPDCIYSNLQSPRKGLKKLTAFLTSNVSAAKCKSPLYLQTALLHSFLLLLGFALQNLFKLLHTPLRLLKEKSLKGFSPWF